MCNSLSKSSYKLHHHCSYTTSSQGCPPAVVNFHERMFLDLSLFPSSSEGQILEVTSLNCTRQIRAISLSKLLQHLHDKFESMLYMHNRIPMDPATKPQFGFYRLLKSPKSFHPFPFATPWSTSSTTLAMALNVVSCREKR